ncbi:hypothetical protein ACQQ2Q_05110 [Agrobacterium sp. ES01]|uniref:hypothetical protein n=1 Tax=Agrobacterium sp. ES01 TaxID=3420714 RepID=UPI003D0D088C
MIKIILAGVWVCIVSLGAVYMSVHMAMAPPEPTDEEKRKAALQLVRGESITIPMIADGRVNGYFVGRISFMMEGEKIKGLDLPMTELMTDELFTLLVGNEMIDISHAAAFNVGDFRDTIKKDLNERLGDELIDEVLVEQLDYISKDDIRANPGERPAGKPLTIVEGVKIEEPKASGGH